MKKTFFIFFLTITSFSFGQNLTEKVGEIEVQLIWHYFKKNSDFDPTKKKTNRKNRPHSKLYFDSNGIILKKIGFGKQHNSDLKLTDYIEVYKYENNRLTESIKYESDYQKKIYPYWKTEFIYNEKEQLIDNSMYYYQTDSLLQKTTFEYDLNSNNTKSIFNPAYYYQREFDSINRITSIKQIYDDKLRWEFNYTYLDNKRIGIFQTHYNDGKDYSKKEILTYKAGKVIECEEVYTSKIGWDVKTKFYYFKNGIIRKIENYEMIGEKNEYQLVSFTEIKVKAKSDISTGTAKLINKEIENE